MRAGLRLGVVPVEKLPEAPPDGMAGAEGADRVVVPEALTIPAVKIVNIPINMAFIRDSLILVALVITEENLPSSEIQISSE